MKELYYKMNLKMNSFRDNKRRRTHYKFIIKMNVIEILNWYDNLFSYKFEEKTREEIERYMIVLLPEQEPKIKQIIDEISYEGKWVINIYILDIVHRLLNKEEIDILNMNNILKLCDENRSRKDMKLFKRIVNVDKQKGLELDIWTILKTYIIMKRMMLEGNIPRNIMRNTQNEASWDKYTDGFIEWITILYGDIDDLANMDLRIKIGEMTNYLAIELCDINNIEDNTLLNKLVCEYYANTILPLEIDDWFAKVEGNNINNLYSGIVKHIKEMEQEGVREYLFNRNK